jgi:diguanylate cyclase (GGDEF)-like protein
MKESDAEFAIVMVDLNNLKYINDEHGHRAGDAYIKGCCHMMCEAFKHSPVFRVGGDEFVAVLTGHDYENRRAIVDQLKSDYEDSYNKGTDPWLKYSAAVGLAENASGDDSVEVVFKRADERMYENKAQIKKKHGDKPRD